MSKRTYFLMASGSTPAPRPRTNDPQSEIISWEVTYNEGGPDVEVGHGKTLLGAYFFLQEFHRQDRPREPLILKTYPEDLMERIDELLT